MSVVALLLCDLESWSFCEEDGELCAPIILFLVSLRNAASQGLSLPESLASGGFL